MIKKFRNLPWISEALALKRIKTFPSAGAGSGRGTKAKPLNDNEASLLTGE